MIDELPFEPPIDDHGPDDDYIKRGYPEIGLLKEQSQKEMQQAVNFYELKTQLADLGFVEPEVTDQLRSIISNSEEWENSAIVHTQKDGVKFEFSLDQSQQEGFKLLFYEAWIYIGEQQHFEFFQMDVPATDALKKLFQQIDNYNTQKIMNTENLSYLQKQLLNMGFGEKLNEELEKNVKDKKPEFTLQTTQEYNKQNVDYTLHYKAGEQNEMYFFNKYDAKSKDMEHTFYINKGSGITAKEAYNLMDGRAVHKQLENLENEKYNAWIVIDKENKTDNGNYKLRTFTDGWNYKPERAIDKLDIVGINEEGARDKLMKSLEKGNRHQVTAIKDGKEVKLFLEANPAEHRVNLTNWKGEAQQLEHYKKPELKNEQKPAQKQADETSKKKRTRSAKQHV